MDIQILRDKYGRSSTVIYYRIMRHNNWGYQCRRMGSSLTIGIHCSGPHKFAFISYKNDGLPSQHGLILQSDEIIRRSLETGFVGNAVNYHPAGYFFLYFFLWSYHQFGNHSYKIY